MYLIKSDFGPNLPKFYCSESKSALVWKSGVHLFEMCLLQFRMSRWP